MYSNVVRYVSGTLERRIGRTNYTYYSCTGFTGSTGHAMCFMTQYVFMTETKHLRISQKHSMRAIFMQIWQLEVILWFMTEKYVHYLKVMKTYFHAVVISTSSDRNRPILQPAGASDERLWVLVCALGSTQGLQVHAEPSKFRGMNYMPTPVNGQLSKRSRKRLNGATVIWVTCNGHNGRFEKRVTVITVVLRDEPKKAHKVGYEYNKAPEPPPRRTMS